jgi:NADH-quinone oxidoreductase subunit L
MAQLLPLIPAFPLIGFLITGLFGKNLPKTVTGGIASLAVLASFVVSVLVFREISATHHAVESQVFTWLQAGNWNIGFSLMADQLSGWMMLIVTGIGFLIHVYSVGYMHDDEGFHKFFAYLNLFVFSMLLLIMGGNFLILFFGWEGVGLCSYLLIGFWYDNAEYGKAARKAFIMNRVGDLGLLLGIFLLFAQFGSVNFSDVFQPELVASKDPGVITAICLLLFVGAMGKSAQIPLYTWLPDAMAGPTPVSALIHAATMVTAGIYMVVRSNVLFSASPDAMAVVAGIGLATSLFAAVIGLRQNDIKKVLAYSTVSQLGLMFLALGMGAYATAIFHVTTHAFFKALLFLGSGAVIHALHGEQDIRNMGGLRKMLPFTYAIMLIGTLAISGFPLLSGFFSKDEILEQVYLNGGTLMWGITLISALITVTYMSRMLFVAFHGEFRGTHEQAHHLHRPGLSMAVPLGVLAVLSVVGGLLNTPHFLHLPSPQWMAEWLKPVLDHAHGAADAHGGHGGEHHDTGLAVQLMAVATVLSLVVMGGCWWIYNQPKHLPVSDAAQEGFVKIVAGKFYVDELYDFLFVRPTEVLSRFLHEVYDRLVIDGLVNGLGRGVVALSGQLRKLQTGNIETYLLGMVLGAMALLALLYQL